MSEEQEREIAELIVWASMANTFGPEDFQKLGRFAYLSAKLLKKVSTPKT